MKLVPSVTFIILFSFFNSAFAGDEGRVKALTDICMHGQTIAFTNPDTVDPYIPDEPLKHFTSDGPVQGIAGVGHYFYGSTGAAPDTAYCLVKTTNDQDGNNCWKSTIQYTSTYSNGKYNNELKLRQNYAQVSNNECKNWGL